MPDTPEKPELEIDWAALLLDYRRWRGLKQAAAAADFGVSQATISRWESGAAVPPIDVQRRLLAAARRERSPISTLHWAATFKRMLVPGLAITPSRTVGAITQPLARGLGIAPALLEGLAIADAFEGDCPDTEARLLDAGFFNGRVASFEAVHRVSVNRQLRRGPGALVHCIGWPHFTEAGVSCILQGVVVDGAEAADLRGALGGSLKITPLG